MSRVFKCDQCKKDDYERTNPIPYWWFELASGSGMVWHFCSLTCLAEYTQMRSLIEEQEATNAAQATA